MGDSPQCFDRSGVGVVDGQRWQLLTNGHAAVAWPFSEAVMAGDWPNGEVPDASGIIRAALARVAVPIPRAELVAAIGQPCVTCADSRRKHCPKCSGAGSVSRGCEHCAIPAHTCPCGQCEGDGWVNCICAGDARIPIVIAGSRAYDAGLVRIVLGAMPDDGELLAAEMPQMSSNPGASGQCLVLRCGDHVGLVMEVRNPFLTPVRLRVTGVSLA